MKKLPVVTIALMMLMAQNVYATPTQEDIQKFNLYYNNGVSYLKNQRYASAIVEFKKVLRYQPFDTSVKQSLCAAYLARAQHYLNNAKDPQKAMADLKSALFYMKFWAEEQNNAQLANMTGSTLSNLASLQRKYEADFTPAQKFQNAKNLRASGELPAAAYDFLVLSNNSQYAKNALENAGDIYKALNNSLDAIECYRKALKVEPKDAKLHFKYAVILDEANNEAAAAEEYNLALKYGEKNPELLDILENLWRSRTISQPKNAQAYANLGTVFQMRGDYSSARLQYQKALALDPNDKTTILNLASLYNAQGLTQEALYQYDRLLSKNPNDIEILNYKAKVYEKANNFNGAIAQYKAILAIQPDNSDAKNDIANIVANKFTPEQKYAYMLQVANENPNNYDLQYGYAYEMHKLKRYNEAINYYKRAIAINPKKAETYINIAQIYTIKDDTQNALNILNEGISAIPYSPELLTQKDNLEKAQAGQLFEMASKYYEQKNYQEALNNYLKIANQTPEVKNAIASCHWELKNYQSAIDWWQKVLKFEPDNEEVLYFSALAYNELNNKQKALELFNKIVAKNPQNTDAKNAIRSIKDAEFNYNLEQAISLYEKKDFTNSLSMLDQLQIEQPKNAYIAYYKGAIFEEEQKQKEAGNQYKLAISYDPNFTLAYYTYAVILDNLENYKDAIVHYEKFLELKTQENVQDEYTNFAQSRVEELKKFLNEKNS